MKVQLVIIVVEKRGDEAAGTGPYGLQLVLYLNFDSAQGGFNATLLRLRLQGPLITWAPSKALTLTFKIPP